MVSKLYLVIPIRFRLSVPSKRNLSSSGFFFNLFCMIKGSPQWTAVIKEKAANHLLIYCLIPVIFNCYLRHCWLFLYNFFNLRYALLCYICNLFQRITFSIHIHNNFRFCIIYNSLTQITHNAHILS